MSLSQEGEQAVRELRVRAGGRLVGAALMLPVVAVTAALAVIQSWYWIFASIAVSAPVCWLLASCSVAASVDVAIRLEEMLRPLPPGDGE